MTVREMAVQAVQQCPKAGFGLSTSALPMVLLERMEMVKAYREYPLLQMGHKNIEEEVVSTETEIAIETEPAKHASLDDSHEGVEGKRMPGS